MKRLLTICVLLLLVASIVVAQMPYPTPPSLFIDTTWNPPAGGTTWTPHNATDFQTALTNSSPGDTIVLDMEGTTTYSGNFTLPAKTNLGNLWIYIESAGLASLPPPGTRTDPSYAPYMAKVVSPNSLPAIAPAQGSNHWRLVGLEVTSTSTQGGNPSQNPPMNPYTYFLIGQEDGGESCFTSGCLPDSITVDRDYIHGSDTQDVREGVQCNITNCAVIDSYISDIHQSNSDSQAIASFWTPGPIKVVDNYLSASTEDLMFGGSGGYTNPYVASDIEIRNNHMFKPLAWDACLITLAPGYIQPNGVPCPPTTSPGYKWLEKNNLEFKSARRVIVTGNTLENNWLGSSGQYAQLLFEIRTTQSGNLAVVDDIEVTGNIIKHGDRGFNTLAEDYACNPASGYPNCTTPGESKRVWIHNNLFLLNPNPDDTHHVMMLIWGGELSPMVLNGLTDWIVQHNTGLMLDGSNLDNYDWTAPGCYSTPNTGGNIWILDNVIGRQVSGQCGMTGLTGLNIYMPNPSPLAPRFLGNVMFAPSGDTIYSWPAQNDVPTAWTFDSNNVLVTPNWSAYTSDGVQAGWNGGTPSSFVGSLTMSGYTFSGFQVQ